MQGVRAVAYGLGSVLIGITLADRGLSNAAVGVVLASLLAGSALVSVLLARHGDRVGRRRCYRLLLVGMAIAGTVFALTGWLPVLIIAGLSGTVSTDVVMHDPNLQRLYVAIGEPGLVCSFDSERLEPLEQVATKGGAHTIGWDPDGRSLYVFCPASRGAMVFEDNA